MHVLKRLLDLRPGGSICLEISIDILATDRASIAFPDGQCSLIVRGRPRQRGLRRLESGDRGPQFRGFIVNFLDRVLQAELQAADLGLDAADLGLRGDEIRLGRIDRRLCDIELDLVRFRIQFHEQITFLHYVGYHRRAPSARCLIPAEPHRSRDR